MDSSVHPRRPRVRWQLYPLVNFEALLYVQVKIESTPICYLNDSYKLVIQGRTYRLPHALNELENCSL